MFKGEKTYLSWISKAFLEYLDQEKNEAKIRGITEIHKAESPVNVLVIPTNEELEIALQTEALIKTAKTL
jgi:acetate kinase